MNNPTRHLRKAVWLLSMLCLSLISCDDKNEKKVENTNDLLSINDENSMQTVDTKIYSLKGDCPETFNNIDFSSLCFTDDQYPSYETGDLSSMKNRCQYTLADGAMELGIVFKDYTGTSAEEVQQRLNAEKQTFLMMDKVMFKKNRIVENLEYYAVISEDGVNDSNLKKLTMLYNNIGIYVETTKDFCGGSDDELLKLGVLALESIIK